MTHRPPRPTRSRAAWAGIAAALAATLAGCAVTPPPQLYQLRSAAPVPVAAVDSAQVLQLLTPVTLPEALDHPALLLPQGSGGVQALAGHRWAEPLRDAVPRLLRQDLALLLGQARVWTAPVPAGVAVTRRLRIELLHLQPDADRRSVRLQARCTLQDAAGSAPPRVLLLEVQAPSADPSPDALVAAHRLALWRLAEQVAAAAR